MVGLPPGSFADRMVGNNYLIFGGMLRWDWMHWIMSMVFFFAGAITVMLVKDLDVLGKEGEFYLLLLTSILGMCLMAGCNRSDYAVPGNRNHLHPAVYPGRLLQTRRSLSGSRFQVSAIWRSYFGCDAVRFQPIVWFDWNNSAL